MKKPSLLKVFHNNGFNWQHTNTAGLSKIWTSGFRNKHYSFSQDTVFDIGYLNFFHTKMHPFCKAGNSTIEVLPVENQLPMG